MFGIEFPQTVQGLLAIGIVLTMLVMFIRETYPVEVVAIGGAVAMLVLGILPQAEGLKVFANQAPWTIAALFIVVGALVRTGGLDWVSRQASAHVERRPVRTVVLLALVVLAMSAFVNNTPVVVVMIPIFMQLAKKLSLSPSKVMIPLSYLTILGGTVTLLGTSTNLLVDGVARHAGLPGFSLFEITPLGLIVAAWGLGYIALFARRLLPDRDSMAALLSDKSKMKFFTEVALPEGSTLIGKRLDEVDIFKRDTARVIDVLRGDASLRRDLSGVVLAEGDRVVLRTPMSEVLGLQQNKDLKLVDKLSSVQTTTVEVLITPGCHMIGRSLGSLRLRRRYGVYPLAVHRRNQNIGRQIDDLVVQVGDTLLLEGAQSDIQRLAAEMNMVDISQPSERAYRRGHAPIVLATLAAIVLLSALEVAPIMVLSIIGVAVVLLTRCIDADEAFEFIEGRLLALIFGMLAVGAGLEQSGAVRMIVEALAPWLADLPAPLLVLAVYVLASTLTEVVSNNAVALIVAPIAIGLSKTLGIDPRPLLVTVMFASSAAFSTPIGYQTNTLVYGPGGYKFTDYLRIGLPLNISLAIVVSLTVPLLWPF
ncbi:SLC13 family permease [Gemmobacter nectariphilus]|uniref:SLC13 family permease n=1 Tax=Gemmobacter nectariphilus TaxID=220343 RepID=UPI0003F4F3F5|nr:SLC13 family permease [Gemmobacter nectariphilus]